LFSFLNQKRNKNIRKYIHSWDFYIQTRRDFYSEINTVPAEKTTWNDIFRFMLKASRWR